MSTEIFSSIQSSKLNTKESIREHMLFSKSQIHWEVTVLAHKEKQWLTWVKKGALEEIDKYKEEEDILSRYRPELCEGIQAGP